MNCRSIAANFDALVSLLNEFEFKFDIIVLIETWLQNSSALLYNIDEYVMFSKQCYQGKVIEFAFM